MKAKLLIDTGTSSREEGASGNLHQRSTNFNIFSSFFDAYKSCASLSASPSILTVHPACTNFS